MKRKFKFRCNPVLPEVYDDALSYYEVLGKLTQAINDMEDEIDEGLIDFIKEALPELIAEATYDDETGTLEFVLVDDVTEEIQSNDPIKRISINGISRPVMDEIARAWFKSSWLYNKNVCMYGDSTLVVPENYAQHIVNSGICASVEVRGVSGNSLTTHGYSLISNATDLNTFDYVFVCYGINDWSGISKNRWITAVSNTIDAIINKGSEPVFVLPWVVYIPTLASNGFINNYGCDMDGYVDGAIEICQQKNVKYFNMCELAGVNQSNYSRKLTPSTGGLYLHEGQELGEYIAAAILNGDYNTGLCKVGNLRTNAFHNFIPTNYAFPDFSTTASLLSGVDPAYRRGPTTGLKSSNRNLFYSIASGAITRLTGFFHHAQSDGYITIGAISAYDQAGTFVPICRVNNNSLFDFTFSPPDGGNDWKLAIDCSSGTAVICDLSAYGIHGAARLIKTLNPNYPAIPITYADNVSLIVNQGYVVERLNSITMTTQTIALNANYPVNSTITIGNIDFYPQCNVYGKCRIGANIESYRVAADGTIQVHAINNAYTAGTRIIFDTLPITVSPFFIPIN